MPYFAVTVEHDLNWDSADAVEARFAEDPWRPMGLLRTTIVEPWEILLDGRA